MSFRQLLPPSIREAMERGEIPTESVEPVEPSPEQKLRRAGEAIPRARREDPLTSHIAAASVSRKALRATQSALLVLLREQGPSTDEDIAVAYEKSYSPRGWPRQSPSGLRTRRDELVKVGLVRDTGKRRRLTTGCRGNVWEVV